MIHIATVLLLNMIQAPLKRESTKEPPPLCRLHHIGKYSALPPSEADGVWRTQNLTQTLFSPASWAVGRQRAEYPPHFERTRFLLTCLLTAYYPWRYFGRIRLSLSPPRLSNGIPARVARMRVAVRRHLAASVGPLLAARDRHLADGAPTTLAVHYIRLDRKSSAVYLEHFKRAAVSRVR